jgi:hypothetical protein
MIARVDHLHWEFDGGPRDTVHVNVDRPCNVFLMDDANYRKYCMGDQHMCYGGAVEKAGLQVLKPNRPGKWHVVVDMGRSGGLINASVKNAATGQPLGKMQSRQLTGAQAGELEFRPGKVD